MGRFLVLCNSCSRTTCDQLDISDRGKMLYYIVSATSSVLCVGINCSADNMLVSKENNRKNDAGMVYILSDLFPGHMSVDYL